MNKTAILLLAVILLAGAVIGTTVAYLTTNTGSIVNTFEYAKVTCEVKESFDGKTKSDVKIENTCKIDAYIRATYVVNWVDADGNILPSQPDGYECVINANPDGKWTEYGGNYYYNTAVAPGASTAGSLVNCTVTKQPENPRYFLQVEIIASAIQSRPVEAVKAAWGENVPLNFN